MRQPRGLRIRLLTFFSALILCAIEAAAAESSLKPVSLAQLCVTEGSIAPSSNNQMQVSVPAMRAYMAALTPQREEARFTYSGSTPNAKPLGSGAIRSQFGLKLHAGDPCNLVYVMWRIEPDKKIVVSVKSNPGQNTSAECGNRGYTNIKPTHSAPAPAVNPGETHTLRAEMTGAALSVYADEKLVWQGSVGADAAALPGPVGIRSDNAALQFQLFALEPSAPAATATACRKGDSD
jgi:hypothetical protein